MTDDQLLAGLESGELLPDQFHHTQHVRAAWIYLNRYPILEAISRFCGTLRAFATALGKPDRYHETITWAYLLLINERIQRSAGAAGWEHFAASNPDLLDWTSPIVRRYYSQDILDSPLARKVFVMPDPKP